MLIAAVWSFVAAPALCRAGTLTVCCAHEDAPAACCQSHETSPADPPTDSGYPPRECGSCADVCKGVAKPDEARNLPGLDTHAQPWDAVAAHKSAAAQDAVSSTPFTSLHDFPRVPFPASGLPLRI
ncbi:MAG: hypothetical protein HRU75_11430 [Planctomycetia bacterium]|nr:MAG: hypothetical protein HRU75_11430 [Planctomycetia bacterium]